MELHHIFDNRHVHELNVGGRGGKEDTILKSLFPNSVRVSNPLYDAEGEGGVLLELKKQKDEQWLDMGKYHVLTEEEKKIEFIFINHTNGRIDSIIHCNIVDFIDLICNDEKCIEKGWTREAMRLAYELRRVAPKVQTKALISPRRLYKKYPNKFTVLYEKNEEYFR